MTEDRILNHFLNDEESEEIEEPEEEIEETEEL